MSKNVKLENFEDRLARAVAFAAKNDLRVKHVQNFNDGGGVTIVYRRMKPNSFIEISTAVCSKRDQYNKKIGRILATESFERGEIVRIPSYGYNSATLLSIMFDILG